MQGYDRLARWYWLLEKPVFRKSLQRARTALLAELPAVHRILMLGDGDGRLLAEVLRVQPHAHVTSVEQSSEMLRLQREQVIQWGASDRVRLVCQDATDWSANGETFDCLITPFFLDCFPEAELRCHLPKWLALVEQGGWFYYIDFVLPSSGWQRLRAKFWSGVMHRFFAWQTGLMSRSLVAVEPFFDAGEWSVHRTEVLNHGFLQARLYRRLPRQDGQVS
ncbi:class I SAM-dependent methyltransferase [Rhodopirellula sp. P2]|uniref:class I SAM-dependent methyltransferase n=1 Tax=Rhodopirellula sp. P2 TaxID=2127060 RepID=UPI002368BDD1|nr:class I SAM-dependent methyltransferase [Rhodopirellula sp. P2]WDQ18111.1 class I SAM-dependent methyltransferase [Rhodopirellula sp. P2]